MRLLVTGTPGVGKTTIALRLAKKLHLKVVSETAFCRRHKIGKWDFESREQIVPLGKLQKLLSGHLRIHDNVIVDGHLSSEIKLAWIDAVIVVLLSPDRLEFRLRERGYNEVKIQDNVLCEGIGYCLNHAKRNYGSRVVAVQNDKEIKQTVAIIIKKLKEKGLVP